mgnify:FL=1
MGCFHKSPSKTGLWKGNSTLLTALNEFLGRSKVGKGQLISSGKAVECGETLMLWVSLMNSIFSCMRVKIVTNCRVCIYYYMVASAEFGDRTTSALSVWGST